MTIEAKTEGNVTAVQFASPRTRCDRITQELIALIADPFTTPEQRKRYLMVKDFVRVQFSLADASRPLDRT